MNKHVLIGIFVCLLGLMIHQFIMQPSKYDKLEKRIVELENQNKVLRRNALGDATVWFILADRLAENEEEKVNLLNSGRSTLREIIALYGHELEFDPLKPLNNEKN